jgi:hypothetical protein
VHGGLRPEFASQGLSKVNQDVRRAIAEADRQRGPAGPDGRLPPVRSSVPALGETGPLWYRGYVQDPEEVACPLLSQALEAVGARRMVVGHTTQKDGSIATRCGGRLVVIDTGISAHYGGHRAALEIRAGDAGAVTPAGPVDLPDPP